MIKNKYKKKIIYFDPLYDEKYGHYYKFTLNSISRFEKVFNSKITFLTCDQSNYFPKDINLLTLNIKDQSLHNIAWSLIKFKNIKKFIFLAKLSIFYFLTVRKLNFIKADYIIFGSSGNIIFWIICILFLKKNYLIIMISLYHHFNGSTLLKRLNFFISNLFLKSSKKIYCLENIYIKKLNKVGLKNTFFMAERVLIDKSKKCIEKKNKQINIITIGTLSNYKNNFEYIQSMFNFTENSNNFKYEIYGKFSEELDLKRKHKTLKKYSNFIHDEYLSNEEFEEKIIKSDIIFFPYNKKYLENMTSGVLYDVFQFRKFVLCPNYPVFSYFINKFEIGCLFTKPNEIDVILNEYLNLLSVFKKKTMLGYDSLFNEFSENQQLKKIKNTLKDL